MLWVKLGQASDSANSGSHSYHGTGHSGGAGQTFSWYQQVRPRRRFLAFEWDLVYHRVGPKFLPVLPIVAPCAWRTTYSERAFLMNHP